MAKKKVVKKQPAKKPTQTQTQNVNVYYGTKPKGKGKPKRSRAGAKPRKESKTISAFNPPPIINFPPQYKPYAVYPEGETAKIFNLNPAVPVPLKIETEAPLLNAPIPEPNLTQLVAPPPAIEQPFVASAPSFEDDISVLSEAPQFLDLPEETAGQVLDLPPAEASALIENKEPLFDPFKVDVPTSSGRSLAESIAEPPSEEGFSYQFSVGEEGYEERLPQSRYLGTLPPIKTAEKSEVSFTPLPSSGLTLPPPLPAIPFDQLPIAKAEKSKKVEGFTGELVVVQPEEEQLTASGRKVRGPNLTEAQRELKKREASEKRKAETKAKKDRTKGASLYQFLPTKENEEAVGIPLQIGFKGVDEGFKYSAPLSQSEGQYEFIGQPKQPTEKETNPLERRRGGGVLTGAEEAVIGGTPAFLTGR
jgi:hypothetical protein